MIYGEWMKFAQDRGTKKYSEPMEKINTKQGGMLYRSGLLIFCFGIAFMIGYIRFLTGPEWALSLFYLLPIGLATWVYGLWIGAIMSVTCAITWLVADLTMVQRFSSIYVPYINEAFRLFVFLMVTYMINRLRENLDVQRDLAGTDPLTHAANRRAFYTIAGLELKKAQRYHKTLSALYIDLDNFKDINDRFGHTAGDRLLKSVVKIMQANVRSVDLTARFGGDEFGILLSESGAESALLVAKKIEKKLLDSMSENGWQVTFSIGVITFERLPDSVDEIIREADAQMYIAKKKGKNRIQQRIIPAENT